MIRRVVASFRGSFAFDESLVSNSFFLWCPKSNSNFSQIVKKIIHKLFFGFYFILFVDDKSTCY